MPLVSARLSVFFFYSLLSPFEASGHPLIQPLTVLPLQGYPLELIGPVVRGVPSMHIATDWIPELLQLPDLEKQMFALELTGHLALQNAMPSTLGVARLAIHTLSTLTTGMTDGWPG